MRIAVLLCILVIIFAANTVLGRFRTKTRKFSWQWLVCLHASVPLIISMRIASGFGYELVPLEVAAAIGGQLLGGSLGA